MIKTFRAKLADGEQDTIRLSTNDGLTGYKIKKFELMPTAPGVTSQESVMKLFTYEPATVTGTIDFDDVTLLGAAFLRSPASIGTASGYTSAIITVFDNVTFNQDIFITHDENSGSAACNYYLELEQVKLDLNEATVATLKDMRGSN